MMGVLYVTVSTLFCLCFTLFILFTFYHHLHLSFPLPYEPFSIYSTIFVTLLLVTLSPAKGPRLCVAHRPWG